MSTAEILSLISTISFAIAALSFVLAVFFWFNFKIPSVIGDLSGRTAKKSIAKMRANNERAGGQGYKPSAANANRGKLTDTMQHSRKLAGEVKNKPATEPKKKVQVADDLPVTELLETNNAVAVDNQQTELLETSEATGLLVDEDATMPLGEESNVVVKRTGGMKLKMLDEVILIHTNEVIS